MIKKRHAWYAQAFLLTFVIVFLVAGFFLPSIIFLILSYAVYVLQHPPGKQTLTHACEWPEEGLYPEGIPPVSNPASSEPPIREIMEVCARFAGGLSHDLNNILSGLITFPEMMLMDLPEDSPFVKPLNAISRSGQRISDVVAQLIDISNGSVGHSMVVNPNRTIENHLDSGDIETLRKTYPDLDIIHTLESGLLNTECIPEHLTLIVKNLIQHCAASMTGKGVVSISTENRYLDTPLALFPETVPSGEYVCLTFSDRGSSIGPEDMAHIFEPYYCKKVLKRSCPGLGMPIVWNIVKSNGGYIDTQSRQKDAFYTIYLPASRQAVFGQTKESVEDLPLSGQGEGILIIDDDPLQRDIASGILDKAGYTTHMVDSGEEAIDFLKTHSVDLLVLDMIMAPGINGYETYREIITFKPDQKAIIVSGFVRTDEMEKVQALGAENYVRKPYSVKQLLEAVKKELSP